MNYKKLLKLIFFFYLLPISLIIGSIIIYVPNSINIISAGFQKDWIEIIGQQVKYKKSSYNELFLPNTQTGKFSYEKIKLKNDLSNNSMANWGKYKFFINPYKKNLYTVSSSGKIFMADLDKLVNQKIDNSIPVKNNFDSSFRVLDFIIFDNKIILSGFKIDEKCSHYNLFISKLSQTLNFEKVKVSQICGKYANGNGLGGRIEKYELPKRNGTNILMTIGYEDPIDEIIDRDYITFNDNSTSGKIILFNLNDRSTKIFSRGHRNQIGLLVNDQNMIISTENGPFGGDEINRIQQTGNYGWPVSSYGIYYPPDWNRIINNTPSKLKYSEKYNYKKSHSKYNYIEPIYSFTPSNGISEIIQVPNDFSEKWVDNYLVASLNGRVLFKMKFNDQLTGTINIEKLFIGERIRDIAYDPEHKTFLLALEESGSIGLLSSLKSK